MFWGVAPAAGAYNLRWRPVADTAQFPASPILSDWTGCRRL